MKAELDPEKRLERFIAAFSPSVAKTAREALAIMRARLPGAIELVYDNYNALAIAFSPTEKASDIVFSIALYPRWVSLFFAHGVALPDPSGLLRGTGTRIRHIVLETASLLDRSPVKKLMSLALQASPIAVDPSKPRRTLVKADTEKKRPRRPETPRKTEPAKRASVTAPRRRK